MVRDGHVPADPPDRAGKFLARTLIGDQARELR